MNHFNYSWHHFLASFISDNESVDENRETDGDERIGNDWNENETCNSDYEFAFCCFNLFKSWPNENPLKHGFKQLAHWYSFQPIM